MLYSGPAPEESQRRIAEFREVLKRDKKTVMGIRKWLQEASVKIEKAIDKIINSHPNPSGSK